MDIDELEDFDLNEDEILRQLLDAEEDYFPVQRGLVEGGLSVGGGGHLSGAVPIPIEHVPMSERDSTGQLFNLTSTSSGSASGASAVGSSTLSYSSSAPSNFPLLARPRLLSPLPPRQHNTMPSTPPPSRTSTQHSPTLSSSGSKTATTTPTGSGGVVTRTSGFRPRSNTGGSTAGRRRSPAENKEDRLEKSRQSARECRQRKKLRYEYLQDLVTKRERAVYKLRDELSTYLEWARQIQETGQIPEGLLKLYQERKIKRETVDVMDEGQPMDM